MCDTKASIVFPVVPGRSLGFGNFFRTILVRPFPTGPPFLAMALPFFPIVAFLCCSAAVDVSICREATGIYTRAHSPSQRKREGEGQRERQREEQAIPLAKAHASRTVKSTISCCFARCDHEARPRIATLCRFTCFEIGRQAKSASPWRRSIIALGRWQRQEWRRQQRGLRFAGTTKPRGVRSMMGKCVSHLHNPRTKVGWDGYEKSLDAPGCILTAT